MINNKNSWFPLLSLLLVFLQPVLSFGNVPTISYEITNNQEETAIFKTKNAKALVYQEIIVASAEVIVSSDSSSKGYLFDTYQTLKFEPSEKESDYLIDFRSVLTTQIFPFHFFL